MPTDLPDRDASCDGKCSLTADLAHRVAARIARRAKCHVEAYRCAWCGFWHVGNSPRRRRKRRSVK